MVGKKEKLKTCVCTQKRKWEESTGGSGNSLRERYFNPERLFLEESFFEYVCMERFSKESTGTIFFYCYLKT